MPPPRRTGFIRPIDDPDDDHEVETAEKEHAERARRGKR